MTTANKVTIGRIILVPFFVAQLLYYFRNPEAHLHWYIAMVIFLVATVSDGVDGYLARYRGQATKLGSYLDPIADKLLMFAGLVLLTIEFEHNPFGQRIPLWLTVAVVGRDAIILIGSILLYLVMGNVEVKPIYMSKTSAVFQMIVIGWVLCKLPPVGTFWLAVISAVTTVITGVFYFREGLRQYDELRVESGSS